MIMDELRKDYMYIVFVKIWELKKNSKFTRSMMRYKIKSKVKGTTETNCRSVLIWQPG